MGRNSADDHNNDNDKEFSATKSYVQGILGNNKILE